MQLAVSFRLKKAQRFIATIAQRSSRSSLMAPPRPRWSRQQHRSRPRDLRRQLRFPLGRKLQCLPTRQLTLKTANEGQTFQADVAENVTNAAGAVVIPKGSEAELIIRKITSPGAVTGTSELALDLQSIKVGGRRYTISTTDVEQKGREGLGTNKRTAEMLGGGAQCSEP